MPGAGKLGKGQWPSGAFITIAEQWLANDCSGVTDRFEQDDVEHILLSSNPLPECIAHSNQWNIRGRSTPLHTRPEGGAGTRQAVVALPSRSMTLFDARSA